MDNAGTQTRIRWNDEELEKLAAKMLQLRSADPQLELLEAVRLAQSVLEPHRLRDITTWGMVEARLQPKLDALQASASQVAPVAVDTEAKPKSDVEVALPEPELAVPAAVVATAEPVAPSAIEDSEEAPSAPVSSPKAVGPVATAAAGPVPLVDPLMVEAAMVAALQSPAVADALVDVFSRAMSQAFSRLSERGQALEPADEPFARSSTARVLLAGFAAPMAKSIEDGISGMCEVRVWKPNQGPQLFETLASICNVAVIPEEMDDEVDNDLRARRLVVIRHGGSTAKLVERLESVL